MAVGRLSRLFGPDGGMTINLYDTFPDNINYEEPLYVVIDTLAVPLFIEELGRRGGKGAHVRFADIDTSTRAERLLGLEVFIRDDAGQEPAEEDELYFEELEGFTAIVSQRGRRQRSEGTITAFFDNDMNPLLEIEIDGKAILVPAAEHFIKHIDTKGRRVEFILPEGFLELY